MTSFEIEVKVKIKEKVPSQRKARNKNANEASNEIPNKMLLLLIMEYGAVTDLMDLNKKKTGKKVLKCLPFRDDSLVLKGFPIDKTKKIFCVLCERLLDNFHGIKSHLTPSLHKNNSSFAFQEENKTCKII